jgi:hypothetical protein
MTAMASPATSWRATRSCVCMRRRRPSTTASCTSPKRRLGLPNTPRDDGLPEGKHDDQVDSTAQFLDWLKMPMASWGIYEATRRRGNRHLTVGLLDGIVEMSAEDAEYLIPAGWIKLAD